ncbi:MAG: DUF3775 domain-containing protein [Pseudomonadota bacterium]
MTDLTFNPEYLRRLIEMMRAVMGPAGDTVPEMGEPSEEDLIEGIAGAHGDPRMQELEEEITALDVDHKHELVALMWVGRGDFTADDWAEAVALAEDRHTGPVARYLLSHPRVADQIASGLEDLGFSHILQDGQY